jgi:inorganic pyrophosphatase
MAETFNVVVEIPRGSKNKYEVDHETGRVFLDRTLFTAMGYPDDYGYIDNDVRFDDIKDIDDVNDFHKAEIKHFFEQYKALEPGKEVQPGDYWAGVDEADKQIKAARERLTAQA